ncbi:minor capsid protein [Tateyamaria sp.]|uniref:minor capsid protein n=1 Tax=Tateyamaria sp. TaxID=1929288 RepID=UPI003B213F1F
MATNDDVLNATTRHEIEIRRWSNATQRKVLAQLKRSDTAIVGRLQDEDISTLSRTRMEALLRPLSKVIDGAYTDAAGVLQADLEGLMEYEGEWQTEMFKRVLPVKFETVSPTADQIIAAVNSRPFQGKLLREVYPELSASAFRKVRDTIRGGFVEGRTTGQIVRDLRGRAALGYKDGILAKSRRDVESVVRTAVNHTANTAREYVYEANTDLVKGVRWNATLDGKTTLVCAGRDGKVYEAGKGPRPPAHFNCRSSTSPVLKSWKELGFGIDELPAGTRASMNGQVPADQDYDGFLRKQGKEFQDGVLGKRKAELFRGGLKVDRFTDKSGMELTLDQLRNRERDIWEKTA